MLDQRPSPTKVFSLCILVCTFAAPTANAQWVTPPANAPGVQQRLFESDAAGQTVSYHIFLPPQYQANPCQRFPVLYWLHGSSAGTTGIAPLTQLYANAMAQGLIPPMLIVFPNGMQYSMWSDSASGQVPMETVVIDDLLTEVDANFRTLAQREGRIIEGFSMGGYGAARLGLKHSHLFAGISMLGAGPMQLDFLDPPPGAALSLELRLQIFEQVWNSNPDVFFTQSPWNIVQQASDQIIESSPKIRLAVGQLDFVVPPNLDFQLHLENLNIVHDFFYPPNVDHSPIQLILSLGTQNWQFYQQALDNANLSDNPDVNNDGQVNLADLNLVLANFGQTTSSGDANGDGVVNLADLNLVLANFGADCN
jgi:S-formylglutathione hydrolase FrmB